MTRLAGALLIACLAACGAPSNGGAGNPAASGSAGSAGSAAAAGAAGAASVTPAPSWADFPAVAAPDPELASFPTREEQYAQLCATPRGDAFFKTICGSVRPNLPDLAELLRITGLDHERAFALNANSTSLVARSVSVLNPRIIVFPRVGPELTPKDDYTIVGFVRGERFVEVASRDAVTGEPNFYLITFEQRCLYQGNCDLASSLTEEIEHSWTAYSIYPESQLENTSFDCLACHRPAGHGTKKILRMQELTSPWLHWFPQRFVQRSDSDRVLAPLFADAHAADQQYGGIPLATIQAALDEGSGAQLEALLRAQGFGAQPNVFDSRIEAEAKAGDASPTWLSQWQVSATGAAITVPYPRADVTDQAKRQAAAASYKAVTSGAAGRETLIDIRDVFSADASEKLSFVPQPGFDGRAILVQMCSRCHDGRADPAVSRSRFNVLSLDAMSADEKHLAVARLQEPDSSVHHMPPWRSGKLTADAQQAAIAELSK